MDDNPSSVILDDYTYEHNIELEAAKSSDSYLTPLL